jgi:hypothetical protein
VAPSGGRPGGRRRREQDDAFRVSDPPDERGRGPLSLRGAATGCGLFVLGLGLLAGVLGLVVGGWQRFGRPAADAARDDEIAESAPPATPPGAVTPGGTPAVPGPRIDPLEDMRRRYLAGPHVRIEGLVPGDRALGGTTGSLRAPRPGDSPWIVLGAAYDTAAAPGPSLAMAPSCAHAPGEDATRPLDVVPGSPALASVQARDGSGGTGVTEYLVAFDGYRGHFVLPARVMTEFGSVAAPGSEGAAIRFTLGAAVRPDGSPIPPGVPFPGTMRIAARDATGHVSAYVARPLNLLGLGTGDVEVTLSMSVPTDLDLYVSDPSGSTVYYGNTTIGSGGHLDLDANAACSGNMGINSEHVFWPAGRAPSGTYNVRVAHFETCVRGAPIDYRVTVRACGETAVLTGRFTGFGNSTSCLGGAGDPTWCQDVVRFSIPPCPR